MASGLEATGVTAGSSKNRGWNETRREFLWAAPAAMMLPMGLRAAGKRPNIVLILADDMGFSDIGCFGSEIDTPHIDRLAREGIRFTNFYNNARCCPSRCSLLTGLYPQQGGIGHMIADYNLPGYRGELNHCGGFASGGLSHANDGQVARQPVYGGASV